MITDMGKESLRLIDKDIAKWDTKKLLEWYEDIDTDFEYDRQHRS